MQPIDILLIEDNEGDILLTTEALQEHKIVNKILVVKDGLEALDFLIKKEPFKNSPTPDLILLDINLPKLNGQEILKRIKSNKQIRHLPVIMLSTSSSQKDISESFKNGADCYITKPIDIDIFIKEISSIKKLESSSRYFSHF